MRTASRSCTRNCAVFEYGLVDRLKVRRVASSTILSSKQLIPERPPLLTARLQYITPPLRLRTVSHPLQPTGSILKILFEVLPVFFLGHAIHSGRLLGIPGCRSRLANCPHHRCGDTRFVNTKPGSLRAFFPIRVISVPTASSLLAYVPVFSPFHGQPTVGTFAQRGLAASSLRLWRLTGPHHSRRGLLLPSFHIGQDTRVLADDSPRALVRRSPG